VSLVAAALLGNVELLIPIVPYMKIREYQNCLGEVGYKSSVGSGSVFLMVTVKQEEKAERLDIFKPRFLYPSTHRKFAKLRKS